jgi:hypothetical protein
MAGSLFVAITAELLAKVSVVDSGEVGRSAVYRTTLEYAFVYRGDFCVFIFNLDKEVSAIQVGF